MVALPSGVEYGNILETNDLVLESREESLECGTNERLVAWGVVIVVVEHKLRLGPVMCSQVLKWYCRGL